MNDKTMKDLFARLDRLEKAVFGDKFTVPEKKSGRKRKGPAQGIRVLIEEGCFSKKQRLSDVITLSAKGYHYSTQAIDTALRRLASRKGPLVVLKGSGLNTYVNRK